MIIGILKEIKNKENRVSLTPFGVKMLVAAGHQVLVQQSAGSGANFTDKEYRSAGALIRNTAEEIYQEAEMIIKVKEPLPEEFPLLRENQIIFTFLHLAAAPELTRLLLEKKVIAIAYETVQLNGMLPILTPMSEIAGKLAVQVGAHYLEKQNGGEGILLGGVPGVAAAEVLIIGGGNVGTSAAKIALGMGASVTMLDINLERLRYLDDVFQSRLNLLSSTAENIEQAIPKTDLLVGAVLIPGAKAAKVVTRAMIAQMRKGAVVVDVAIDQGGCIETSKATSFDHPVYEIDGVIHYCVPNIPGCVPRTSTFALVNATLPYILKLANLGCSEALRKDPALRRGLNMYKGKLTNPAVAEAYNLKYITEDQLDTLLSRE